MGATTFEAIETEFLRRVGRTVWCSVATVDARDRGARASCIRSGRERRAGS
jgi:hypothetical protein